MAGMLLSLSSSSRRPIVTLPYNRRQARAGEWCLFKHVAFCPSSCILFPYRIQCPHSLRPETIDTRSLGVGLKYILERVYQTYLEANIVQRVLSIRLVIILDSSKLV
jgi:hypothetical protein